MGNKTSRSSRGGGASRFGSGPDHGETKGAVSRVAKAVLAGGVGGSHHGLPEDATCQAFHKQSGVLAVGTSQGAIKVFFANGLEVLLHNASQPLTDMATQGDAVPVSMLTFINEGNVLSETASPGCEDTSPTAYTDSHLVAVFQNSAVQVWSLSEQRLVSSLAPSWTTEILTSVAATHPDSSFPYVFLGAGNATVYVLRALPDCLPTGYTISRQDAMTMIDGDSEETAAADFVCALAPNPQDECQLLIGYDSGNVVVWDVRLRRRLKHFRSSDPSDLLTALAWHPDGHHFAAGYQSGMVTIWQVEQGRAPVASLPQISPSWLNAVEVCPPPSEFYPQPVLQLAWLVSSPSVDPLLSPLAVLGSVGPPTAATGGEQAKCEDVATALHILLPERQDQATSARSRNALFSSNSAEAAVKWRAVVSVPAPLGVAICSFASISRLLQTTRKIQTHVAVLYHKGLGVDLLGFPIPPEDLVKTGGEGAEVAREPLSSLLVQSSADTLSGISMSHCSDPSFWSRLRQASAPDPAAGPTSFLRLGAWAKEDVLAPEQDEPDAEDFSTPGAVQEGFSLLVVAHASGTLTFSCPTPSMANLDGKLDEENLASTADLGGRGQVASRGMATVARIHIPRLLWDTSALATEKGIDVDRCGVACFCVSMEMGLLVVGLQGDPGCEGTVVGFQLTHEETQCAGGYGPITRSISKPALKSVQVVSRRQTMTQLSFDHDEEGDEDESLDDSDEELERQIREARQQMEKARPQAPEAIPAIHYPHAEDAGTADPSRDSQSRKPAEQVPSAELGQQPVPLQVSPEPMQPPSEAGPETTPVFEGALQKEEGYDRHVEDPEFLATERVAGAQIPGESGPTGAAVHDCELAGGEERNRGAGDGQVSDEVTHNGSQGGTKQPQGPEVGAAADRQQAASAAGDVPAQEREETGTRSATGGESPLQASPTEVPKMPIEGALSNEAAPLSPAAEALPAVPGLEGTDPREAPSGSMDVHSPDQVTAGTMAGASTEGDAPMPPLPPPMPSVRPGSGWSWRCALSMSVHSKPVLALAVAAESCLRTGPVLAAVDTGGITTLTELRTGRVRTFSAGQCDGVVTNICLVGSSPPPSPRAGASEVDLVCLCTARGETMVIDMETAQTIAVITVPSGARISRRVQTPTVLVHPMTPPSSPAPSTSPFSTTSPTHLSPPHSPPMAGKSLAGVAFSPNTAASPPTASSERPVRQLLLVTGSSIQTWRLHHDLSDLAPSVAASSIVSPVSLSSASTASTFLGRGSRSSASGMLASATLPSPAIAARIFSELPGLPYSLEYVLAVTEDLQSVLIELPKLSVLAVKPIKLAGGNKSSAFSRRTLMCEISDAGELVVAGKGGVEALRIPLLSPAPRCSHPPFIGHMSFRLPRTRLHSDSLDQDSDGSEIRTRINSDMSDRSLGSPGVGAAALGSGGTIPRASGVFRRISLVASSLAGHRSSGVLAGKARDLDDVFGDPATVFATSSLAADLGDQGSPDKGQLGELQKTKQALEERGEALRKISERTEQLRDASQQYRQQTRGLKEALKRKSNFGF